VVENRVLREVFVLEREEVTGDGENYHEKLQNFCSSPNIEAV
jgi:hypothetical protein